MSTFQEMSQARLKVLHFAFCRFLHQMNHTAWVQVIPYFPVLLPDIFNMTAQSHYLIDRGPWREFLNHLVAYPKYLS
jgi:hypothetical protein